MVSAAEAQTDPPVNGDWTVSDRTVVTNQMVKLHGNLTVEADGYLTLRNVTLQVFSSVGDIHGIKVEANGSLKIEDLDGRSSTEGDRSVVMRGNPSHGYYFTTDAGSNLSIRFSLVSGMGSSRANDGLLIRSERVLLRSSTFMDGEGYSVKLAGTNGSRVVDCAFYLSDDGLVAEDCENLSVDFSVFMLNDGTGLRIIDSSSTSIANVESAENSQNGIVLKGAYNTSLIDAHLHENLRGLVLDSVRQLYVSNVKINDSNFEGILIEPGCQDISLDQVEVFDCFRSGLEGEGVRDLVVTNSTFRNMTYYGIRLLNGSIDLEFTDVQVNDNGYDGIHIERATGVLMTRCLVMNNSYNGVFLVDIRNVTLVSNVLRGNRYDGFNCDNTRNLTIRMGVFERNGYNGVNVQAGSSEVVLEGWPVLQNNTRSGLGIDSARNISLVAHFIGNGDYGVRIESGASNISLYRCLLDNNTNGAMRVEKSWDVRMGRSFVNQFASSTHALSVRNAGDIWITNCSAAGIVNVSNGGNATIVNSTFEDLSPDVDASSWLDYVHWAYVKVVWPNLLPVEGAVVNATGSGGMVLDEAVTNATGLAGPLAVAFNRFVGNIVDDRNPVTFWARRGNEIARTTVTVLRPTLVWIILADDLPPVAVAGDIFAELGERTTLNGSQSHDNGQVVSWVWTFDDGVGTVVLDGRIVNWTFNVLGNFTGQLNVSDMMGLSNVTTFTITVVDTTPPTVVTGGNVTIDQHEQITLDGTGSSDNDSTLVSTGTFIWLVRLDDDALPIGTREGPLETWTFDDMGLYRVDLEVTDQSGNVATGEFWVTVRDITPPRVDLGPDIEVYQGYVLVPTYQVTDNDPSIDVANSSYWLVETPQGERHQVPGIEFEFAMPVMGDHRVTLFVEDPSGNGGSDTMVVHVLDAVPPTVRPGIDSTVDTGSTVTLDAGGTTDNDPDFPDGATFRWRLQGPKLDITLTGVNVSFVPPWIGEYSAELTVSDAAGNSASASITITSVDGALPLFAEITPPEDVLNDLGEVGVAFVILDVGTGVDKDTVEFRTRYPGEDTWSEWVKVGLDDGGNRVEGSMLIVFPEGWSTLQMRCLDLAGNGPVLSEEHLIKVNSRPRVVVLSPSNGSTYAPFDEIVLDAGASSDPDGDELFFRWSSDIDGLLGTNATVRAPPLSEGTHRLTVLVSDGIEGHDMLVEVVVRILPEPATVGTDDGFPWLVLAMVLLLLLATGFVVWDYMRRRNPPPPPPPAQAEGAPGTEAVADEWVETPETGEGVPLPPSEPSQLE